MKKLTILFLLVFGIINQLSAHNLWLETDATGTIGKTQQVHVYYGEYTYNYYEKVDENFKDVDDFDLWLVAPNGDKTKLEPVAGNQRYTAEFTPDQNGSYTIILESTRNNVVDWREYDLGILKPNFYASTSIAIGNPGKTEATISNQPKLFIKDNSSGGYQAENQVNLTVLFNGKPVAKQEVIVTIADQWTKTVTTNENGKTTFNLPWSGQYVLEVIYTEEQSGSFQGTDFEAIRHTATYTIQANK
ncbi:DUF4198 domain-containing protein [Fodinibius sp. Rm-B-1B1-1]|uniref:DUF4198 domain-containing protein n=1 Tax=Fodinibius alkaliphilus TaxID=3140241 RepID=UPI00315A44CD